MAFWLFDWFQSNGITTADQIQVLLTDKRQFETLRSAAARVQFELLKPLESSRGLVAGRGIDLTGIGACRQHRECIRGQVDKLLRRAWFYFDEIVVDDMTRSLAVASSKRLDVEAAAGWLESVLYLQQIGADDLVRFYSKNIYCEKCGREHARDLFHGNSETFEEDLIALLERQSHLAITDDPVSPSQARVLVHGPQFGDGWGGVRARTWLKRRSEAAIKRELIESALDSALPHLYNDAEVARRAGAPLGSASKMESFLLEYGASPSGDITNSVVFSLALPFIDNVPVSELIKIRTDEYETFEAFRAKVRLAIHDRVKTADDPNPLAVAQQIEQDVIEPSLADLRMKLKRNADSLSKSISGAGLGAFAGVVGLLVPGLQLVGAAGGMLSVASTNAALSQLKERDGLKANEMFLLLEAQRRHA